MTAPLCHTPGSATPTCDCSNGTFQTKPYCPLPIVAMHQVTVVACVKSHIFIQLVASASCSNMGPCLWEAPILRPLEYPLFGLAHAKEVQLGEHNLTKPSILPACVLCEFQCWSQAHAAQLMCIPESLTAGQAAAMQSGV